MVSLFKVACGNVESGRLWDILKAEGLKAEFIKLLGELYREKQVQIVWEGVTYNRPVHIYKGLKQGCPLSLHCCSRTTWRGEKVRGQ